MQSIKWIKLSTDLFSNRKIKLIRAMQDGDAIVCIWLQILCLAGTTNDNGYVYFTKDIPYTDDMLATAFDRPLDLIQTALKVFQDFQMIEIVDDILLVSNWEKYQSDDGLEGYREKNRQRQAAYRERQKQAAYQPNADSTPPEQTAVAEQPQPKQLTPAQIVDEYDFPPDVKQAVIEWLQYKKERRQSYKPTGLKSFLNNVAKQLETYPAPAVIEIIRNSMASNYQGVVWDRLRGKEIRNDMSGNLFAKRAMEMEG